MKIQLACLQKALYHLASHVHADTIPLAIRPGLMLREAVLNSSLVLVSNRVYLF